MRASRNDVIFAQLFQGEAIQRREAEMKSVAVLYGVVVYAIFFVTLLYAIGFVAGAAPKSIDSGPVSGVRISLVVDLLLLGLFAVQHSLMARPAFKTWWTRFVPKPVERSTYVLAASLCLILLYWQWRPLPPVVWSVTTPWAVFVLWAVSALGWATVLLSTFLINHFDLFGLRQVWAYRTGKEIPPPEFRTPLFYKVVRHPLYLGFILAFWATPNMTQGHLLFAAATTAYILIGIQLEERDLLKVFGARYEAYREEAGMLYPKPRRTPPSGVGHAQG
jgi:protein-S-isoprenylcysteine O-methyltransferase Ste14